jgi:hypothetical protein
MIVTSHVCSIVILLEFDRLILKYNNVKCASVMTKHHFHVIQIKNDRHGENGVYWVL